MAGAPLPWESHVLAACWAGGFRGVASHRSAAALYGLAGGRRTIIEVTCPRWRRARHDGLVVHETKTLAEWDVAIVQGIPATTVERTLLDLGAVCGPGTVRIALDAAEHRGLTSLKRVEAALARLAESGRPGVTSLRQALDAALARRGIPESEMETMLLDAIRRHGLPEPVLQYEIRDARGRFVARVDGAYPWCHVTWEYDSKQEHTGELALARDAERRNRIVLAGFSPLTVRYEDLRAGGAEFCATLRSLISRFERPTASAS